MKIITISIILGLPLLGCPNRNVFYIRGTIFEYYPENKYHLSANKNSPNSHEKIGNISEGGEFEFSLSIHPNYIPDTIYVYKNWKIINKYLVRIAISGGISSEFKLIDLKNEIEYKISNGNPPFKIDGMLICGKLKQVE